MTRWMVLPLLALAACPPPLPEPKDPDAFELEVPVTQLGGTVVGEPWSLLQGFAMGDEATGYTLFFADSPVTVCDEATAFEVGVLRVDVAELGLQPWGEGATNRLQLADGQSLSTLGGGIDVDLDPTGAYLDGGMVVDVSEETLLEGRFNVPLCE